MGNSPEEKERRKKTKQVTPGEGKVVKAAEPPVLG